MPTPQMVTLSDQDLAPPGPPPAMVSLSDEDLAPTSEPVQPPATNAASATAAEPRPWAAVGNRGATSMATPTPNTDRSSNATNTIAPHAPTFGENLKRTVFNSAIGDAINSTMPALADKLGIRGMGEQPGADPQLVHPEDLFQGFMRKSPTDAATPVESVMKGVGTAAGGLTTADSLAMMAGAGIVPEWMAGAKGAKFLQAAISTGFTAQMVGSLYQNSKEFKKQMDAGDTSGALETLGAMGVNGFMAFHAGKHAAEMGKASFEKTEPGTSAPSPDSEAASTTTQVPTPPLSVQGDELPPKQRDAGKMSPEAEAISAKAAAEHNPNLPTLSDEDLAPQQQQPVGATEPETGRTVLQPTDQPEVNQALATDAHPDVKSQLRAAIDPVDGAKIHGARDEKDPERLNEKIEGENQPAETVPDYSGFRVSVDSQSARDAAVKAIRDKFAVVKEKDELENGADDTGFHAHVLQVQGENGATHEIQLLPKEVADQADAQHGLYEKARNGDADAQAQLKQANAAAYKQFTDRNAANQPAAGVEPQKLPVKAGDHVILADGDGKFDMSRPRIGKVGGSGKNGEGKPWTRVQELTGRRHPNISPDRMVPLVPKIEIPELGKDQSPMNKEAWDLVAHRWPHLVQEYLSKNSKDGITEINTDAAKEVFPSYQKTPTEANSHVQAPAGAIADTVHATLRNLPVDPERPYVRISAGSPSSGKTASGGEGEMRARAKDAYRIEKVPKSSKKLIADLQAEFDAGRKPILDFFYVNDFRNTVKRAIGRATKTGRSVPVGYMAERWSTIPKIIQETQAHFGNKLQVRAFDNSGKPGEAVLHYNADDAVAQTEAYKAKHDPLEEGLDELHEAYKAGVLTESLYHEFTNDLPHRRIRAGTDADGRGSESVPGRLRTGDAGANEEPAKGLRPEVLGSETPASRAASASGGIPPGEAGTMRVADLSVDPRRFQYKLRTDAAGVTDTLKGLKWDPALAGEIHVWRDPQDGKTYVVNGHHRFDLARANGVKSLRVFMLDEPTEAAARATGARVNIAGGQGTALDAAKFFRDSGLGLEEIRNSGISPKGVIAREGLALSRLNPRLFDDVVQGKLRENRAIAIGEATDKPEQQDAISKLIDQREAKGRTVSDATIEELGRMVQSAGEHTEIQDSLFGSFEKKRSTVLEKAEVSSYIRNQIGQEKRLFGAVADEGKAKKLAAGNNTIDTEKNAEISKNAAQALEMYDKLSTRTGALDDVLNRAADDLAKGKGTPSAIKGRAYEEARAALANELAGKSSLPKTDAGREGERAQVLEKGSGSGRSSSGGGSEAEPPRDKDDPVNFARRAVRSEDSFTLPGMESDVAKQGESAAAVRGEELTSRLTESKGDISKTAGEMERNSPLFRDTDANPQSRLFNRAPKGWDKTGESAKDPYEQARLRSSADNIARISHEIIPATEKTASALRVSDDTMAYLERTAFGDFRVDGARINKEGVDYLSQEFRRLAEEHPDHAQQLTALADSLQSNRGKSGGTVVIRSGLQKGYAAKVLAEEHFHDWQQSVGLADATEAVDAARAANPEAWKRAAILLKQRGYESAADIRMEIPAKIASGQADTLHMKPEAAKSILSAYLDAVHKRDGDEAITSLPDVAFKDAVPEVRREGSKEQSVRGSVDHPRGNPQRVDSSESGAGPKPAGKVPTEGSNFSKTSRAERVKGDTERADEVGKPLDSLVEGMKDLKGRKMSIGEHMADSVERAAESVTSTASGLQKTFAKARGAMAGVWTAYNEPPAWTDFKSALGDKNLQTTEAALRLHEFTDEIKRVAPTKLEREALTNWAEANGNPQVLRERATRTQDPKLKAGYQKALELTPEQKDLGTRIQRYHADMLQLAKDNDMLDLGARNYVSHMYEGDTADKLISAINFNDLAPDPAFLKQRIFRTYFDAEQAGERPKNKDIGFLMSGYHDSFAKAIASRTFIRRLIDGKAEDGRPLAVLDTKGQLVTYDANHNLSILERRPAPEFTADYKHVDSPQLRNFRYELDENEAALLDPKLWEDDTKAFAHVGNLILHPDIADRVKEMVTNGSLERSQIGSAALKVSSGLKHTLLSLSAFHYVTVAERAAEHWVNPFKQPKLDLSDPNQRDLVAHGLNVADFSAEGVFSTKLLGGALEAIPGLNKFADVVHGFEAHLFQKYIPQLKMATALEALKANAKRYNGKLTRDQILEMTAKQANATYGGLNHDFDKFARSNNTQAFMRLTLLAPDFLESNLKYYGQAFSKYGAVQRVSMLRGAAMIFVGTSLINMMFNHGSPMKKDLADWDSIVISGKRIKMRSPAGDLTHLATDPRGFLANRLNPMTMRPLVELATGRDQQGRQKSVVSMAGDYVKGIAPLPSQKVLQNPEEGWMDSVVSAMGFNLGIYRTPAAELAHKLHIQAIPDNQQDPDKQAQSRKIAQMVQQMRDGKLNDTDIWNQVKDGKLTPHQAAEITKRGRMTQLENDTNNLTLEQVLQIYEKANPAEKQVLIRTIAKKTKQIPERPEDQRGKLEEQVQKVFSEYK